MDLYSVETGSFTDCGGVGEPFDDVLDLGRGQLARRCGTGMREPDPIAAFTTMWRGVLIETDFEGGCPVLAAACSRDEAPEAAAAAADAYATWAEMLAERLRTDGIKASVAQSLSTTIVAAFEGAVVLSRATRSTQPLDAVARHMSELVVSHRPRSTRTPSGPSRR